MNESEKQLRALDEMSRAIAKITDSDRLVGVFAQEVANLVEADACLLLSTDREGRGRIVASVGLPNHTQELELPMDDGLEAAVRHRLGSPPMGTLVITPFECAPDVQGVIAVYWRDSVPQPHRGIVSALAGQAAIVLERALAQQAVRRWKEVFELAPCRVAFGSSNGTYEAVNPAFARLHGYTVDELRGRPIADLWPAELRPELAKHVRATFEQGHHTWEGLRLRKDGTTFPSVVEAVAIKDSAGRVVRAVVNVQDVTELKKAERARQRLAEEQTARHVAEQATGRARLLAAADELLVGSLDYDKTFGGLAHLLARTVAGFCVVDIVEEAGAVRRATASRLDSAPLLSTVSAKSTDSSAPEGLVGRVMRAGEPEHHSELTPHEASDLTDLIEAGARSLSIVPMAVSRDRAVGAVVLASTDPHWRLDPADLVVVREIARRAAWAVSSARSYEKARQAIRVRDDFLAVASHELRTPLSALVLHLNAMQRIVRDSELNGLGPFSEKLEKATRQTDRLARLVDSILDASRLSSGMLKLHREEFDLAEAASDVLERFAHDAARTSSELRLEVKSEARGKWDRIRIEQVLTNLLSNAIKYGVGHPIDVAVEADGTTARISVTDEGIGISAEDTGRIFGPYERAVSTRHYGGLGLGLYIARQIAEAHEGTIRVASRPGAGSTFSVELPRSPIPEVATEPAAAEDGLR